MGRANDMVTARDCEVPPTHEDRCHMLQHMQNKTRIRQELQAAKMGDNRDEPLPPWHR